jgi:transposase
LALGGRPAASFAKRLMLPVSNDTLLRVVRRRTAPRADPLTVVGVDDWAFRRNRRYGTIVCDLERRRIVTLLPDRGGGYGEAAARALPDAVQVADRWHLMENASSAFLDAVRKSMRAIRSAIGSTTITPELLTSAEKLRYESYLRREDTNTAIVALARDGVSIKQIVRRLGHSRNLVRQTLRGGRADVFQTRQRSLDAYYLFLEGQWSSGCRNGAELWRRLQARGFRGSLRSVGEWTTRRRRSEAVSKQQLQRVPSARTIARLMTIERDYMTKADAVVIAAIEAGVPSLVETRTLIDQFHDMIRKKDEAKLDAWLANAKTSLVSSFATGVLKDIAAVRAAITQPWSNGQVEAQITKLKLVKRQMYGRAKIDLLEARLLGTA